MPVQVLEAPTSIPKLMVAGAAIGLAGLGLLCSAVPALLCVPSSPRGLRLGALGVRLAAALVGLLSDAENAAEGGALASLGVLLACVFDIVFGAWKRQAPKDHAYQLLGKEDDELYDQKQNDHDDHNGASAAAPHDGIELTSPSPSSSAAAASSSVSPPPCRVSVLDGLGLSSASLYFAFLRGLQLGADVYVVGGGALEVAVACTFGQICLMSGALSVSLQDTRGLSLAAAAAVVAIFSLMAPLGMVVGAASFGIFDARAAHVRKGFGGIVLPSASSINDRGVALARLSCVVAGVLLQQTVAGVLPREQRDAENEWAYKFGPSVGGGGNAGGVLCLDAVLHKGVAGRYARTQVARIAALCFGWAAMTSLHWPALARKES